MTDLEGRAPKPPTGLAREFVRYVVGFGMGVGAGVLEALPLRSLYPEDLRPNPVAISAFVMGMVAVGLQFASSERASRRLLRYFFVGAVATVAAALVLVITIYPTRTLAIRVDPAADPIHTFVIAPDRLEPPACPCPTPQSDEECIKEWIAQERVAQCWGKAERAESNLLLLGGFVGLTTGFGGAIGALILQGLAVRRKRRQEGARSGRRRPKKGSATQA